MVTSLCFPLCGSVFRKPERNARQIVFVFMWSSCLLFFVLALVHFSFFLQLEETVVIIVCPPLFTSSFCPCPVFSHSFPMLLHSPVLLSMCLPLYPPIPLSVSLSSHCAPFLLVLAYFPSRTFHSSRNLRASHCFTLSS